MSLQLLLKQLGNEYKQTIAVRNLKSFQHDNAFWFSFPDCFIVSFNFL